MLYVLLLGVEFFEYRRRLFFAGLSAPETPSTEPLPSHYFVSPLLPLQTSASTLTSSPSRPRSDPMAQPSQAVPAAGASAVNGKGRETETSQAHQHHDQRLRPFQERLEAMLSVPGAEELQETWVAGVGAVARGLHDGKRLTKPLRLGLVVSDSIFCGQLSFSCPQRTLLQLRMPVQKCLVFHIADNHIKFRRPLSMS